MQLETEEPPHRALPTGGEALEHLVAVYALVLAHPHGGGIHEADAGTLAQENVLDEYEQQQRDFTLQLHEPAV